MVFKNFLNSCYHIVKLSFTRRIYFFKSIIFWKFETSKTSSGAKEFGSPNRNSPSPVQVRTSSRVWFFSCQDFCLVPDFSLDWVGTKLKKNTNVLKILKNRKTWKNNKLEKFPIFRFSNFQIFEFSDFRIFRFSDFRIFEFSDFLTFNFSFFKFSIF